MGQSYQGFYRSGLHYRFEYVKCGRCGKPCLHGPYWYAYEHRKTGQLKKTYIGKRLPEEVLKNAPQWARRMHGLPW